MAAQSHMFKRLVLGLEPSAPGRTMRLAVELAELLHLELLGLFLEDPSLRNLAAIPFVREFRLLGGDWRPIELERLTDELELAVRSAERLFADAAKDLTTRCQFEVSHEAAAEAVASISRSGDIIVIAEPATPVGRATQQFYWLLNAAFHSASAVMLVPARIARAAGPVVAIAVKPDDPSIPAAATIAIAAGEDLVIVHTYEGRTDDPEIRKLADETGLTIKHTFMGKAPLSDLAVRTHTFRHVQERLVVAARSVLAPELALSFASSRRIPVLVIAPSESAPSSQ
jgi:hypothetical protein